MASEPHVAVQSGGTSSIAVHGLVERIVQDINVSGGCVLDVGCGTGTLRERLIPPFDNYVGLDIVRYQGLPGDVDLTECDLDAPAWPLPDAIFDAVISVETIEHVENPRAYMREISRLVRPGGWVLITTPNQTSWLNLLALAVKRQHVHFMDKPGQYPTHKTALLPIDLQRIAIESGLRNPAIRFTGVGRVPGVRHHWPQCMLTRGPGFSDNVAMLAQKPEA